MRRPKKIINVLDGDSCWHVRVDAKLVDSTALKITAPGMARNFQIDAGANVCTPHSLVGSRAPAMKYVVLGAGRASVDSVLWLLSHGVSPARVQWVMPRDHWYYSFEAVDPNHYLQGIQDFLCAAAKSNSVQECERALERGSVLCRATAEQPPEATVFAFKGARLTRAEQQQCWKVTDIVRMGRVKAVRQDSIELEKGTVDLVPGAVVIDCTSTWSQESKAKEFTPIFEEGRITLQPVTTVFTGPGDLNICVSASAIGFLEACEPYNVELNNLQATPTKMVDTCRDWFELQIEAFNQLKDPSRSRNGSLSGALISMRPSLYAACKPDKLRKFFMQMNKAMPKFIADLTRVCKGP